LRRQAARPGKLFEARLFACCFLVFFSQSGDIPQRLLVSDEEMVGRARYDPGRRACGNIYAVNFHAAGCNHDPASHRQLLISLLMYASFGNQLAFFHRAFREYVASGQHPRPRRRVEIDVASGLNLRLFAVNHSACDVKLAARHYLRFANVSFYENVVSCNYRTPPWNIAFDSYCSFAVHTALSVCKIHFGAFDY